MNLQARLRILFHKRANSPRLGAAQILADHAAGGQVDGDSTGLDGIAARAPRGPAEVGFTVAGVELPVFEQARRSGMVQPRAWPEDALVRVYPLISDSVIVRDSALRRYAKLFENVARRCWKGNIASAETMSQSTMISESRRACPGGVTLGAQ